MVIQQERQHTLFNNNEKCVAHINKPYQKPCFQDSTHKTFIGGGGKGF